MLCLWRRSSWSYYFGSLHKLDRVPFRYASLSVSKIFLAPCKTYLQVNVLNYTGFFSSLVIFFYFFLRNDIHSFWCGSNIYDLKWENNKFYLKITKLLNQQLVIYFTKPISTQIISFSLASFLEIRTSVLYELSHFAISVWSLK